MSTGNKLLGNIDDPMKKAIVRFLMEHDASYMGDIIKNLSVSYSKGQKLISELKQDGLIENRSRAPKYTLATR